MVILPNVLPTLTREYILKHITQEEIFAKFLPCSYSDIEYCLAGSGLIKSPLRTDREPTCSFQYDNKGRLKFKDFAGYFWGDCFDVVAYRINLDASATNDFPLVLEEIAHSFRLHKYSDGNFENRLQFKSLIDFNKKIFLTFDFNFRSFNQYDKSVWKHLSVKDLEKELIYPVSNLWINDELKYNYRTTDPCYAYYLGKNLEGKLWKVYFPYRDKFRFLSNSSVVQGINTFKKCEYFILTKSYKDVVYLRKCGKALGINSASPASETVLISSQQDNYFTKHSNFKASLFDFDNTGIHMAWQLRKAYNYKPYFLNTPTYQRKVYYEGCKDFSDYVQKFGLKEGTLLLEKHIKQHENKI
jgi:hypothetical protein